MGGSEKAVIIHTESCDVTSLCPSLCRLRFQTDGLMLAMNKSSVDIQ